MIRIGIPVLHYATALEVAAPRDIFTFAAHYMPPDSREQLSSESFQVEFVGLNEEPVRCGDGILLMPQQVIANPVTYDVILVPSFSNCVDEGLEANRAFIPWLRERYQNGHILASWCSGTFMLAAAGVLDGKAATTHWALARKFSDQFPQVDLQPDRLVIDEGDVITCGGATSFLNLVIYLIERFHSYELAVACAKMFLIDMDRRTQLPYTGLTQLHGHADGIIGEIQLYIETNLTEDFSLQRLADRAKLSSKTFMRRFKEATGLPPTTYVQRVRIEAAKQALEQGDATVEDITCQVGYSDIRSFRRLFRRYAGLTPKDYRAKFQAVATYAL